MKKVAWGVTFYLLSGMISLLLLLAVSLMSSLSQTLHTGIYYVQLLIPGLVSAAGFYLLMRGAESLGFGGNVEWVRKISMVLAAYALAETLLSALGLMPDLGVLSTVLAYAYSLGGFLAVYLMTLSMAEIQVFRRIRLYAQELQKWFTVWVITGFVGSLLPALYILAALAELVAAVIIAVYFFKAAKNYGEGSGNYRVM